MEKESRPKLFDVLISFREVKKLQRFEFHIKSYKPIYKAFYIWFSLYILVNFMEKEPFRKIYGVLDHLSRTCAVIEF